MTKPPAASVIQRINPTDESYLPIYSTHSPPVGPHLSSSEITAKHWPVPITPFASNHQSIIQRPPNPTAMETVSPNTNIEHYDCIAIGSGEAGKLVPFLLSGQHNKKCAIIERQYIGGSCPNIACLPSKSVIHAANLAHEARMVHKHGLAIPGVQDLKSNLEVVKKRKDEMVKAIDGFRDLFEGFGVELIRGEGRFVSPKLVQVSGGRLLSAENIVICTGSRAVVDARIPGLVEARPITHVEILDLETLPSHLIIIGGGYVGLEFAQAYRRFGSEVTVI